MKEHTLNNGVDKGTKWFVVVNPISGSGKGLDDFPLISKLLRDNGIKCEAVFTEHKHHATELTVSAINSGYRNIIVAGGDGTLHEVINGLFIQKCVDTSEVTKVHNIEKAAAQTPENMEPGAFTSDRDATLEAAGITKPGETAEIKESDSKDTKNAKGRYNKSMMSIWDAYNNGLIDKETAGYFTIDAISTLAKNLGRSIGNVGAQFSGGTIDQGHDESMWDQRRNEIFNQELTGEAESIDNYNNLMKKYNLNKASTINNLMASMEKDIANMDDKNPMKVTYMALEAAMANGMIDGNTTLAATGAKGISSIIDWFKEEKGNK